MSLMYQSMSVTHEKDTIGWRNQWVAIPEICLYLSAQLNYTRALLKGGRINLAQVEKNLQLKAGEIVSERIMLLLGQKIGKQSAHHLLYQLMNHAKETGQSFAEAVAADPTIQRYFSEAAIAEFLDPKLYTGLAVQKTEAIVAAVRAERGNF